MTVINTLVAKSNNVNAAALNLNAKAFEIRRTLAGVWDLKPSTPEAPRDTFHLDMKNPTDESVIGDGDDRVKVDKKHFLPGGKYRSIVKIFIHYEFQQPGKWAMGTGWLIRPDVLVTAGHCTYDWSHSLGRATEIKAYVGYSGQASIQSPNVQFRTAKRIVTTEGWLKARGAKNFDVGFVQVNKPFTGIIPIKYEETPVKGDLTLGVVGYPGDLKDEHTGEKGAFMYEMFLPTKFDLATQADTMLEYQIDTFGGNSGSPVLKEPGLVSIGAHVYGGTFNSASVIGKLGNPYNDYIAALSLPKISDGLDLVPVTGPPAVELSAAQDTHASLVPTITHTGSYLSGYASVGSSTNRSNLNGSSMNGSAVTGATNSTRGQLTHSSAWERTRHLEDEEGFFDFMKDALRVGAPLVGTVLKSGLPLAMGPLGGPIGALAGLALNAAGKLAETTETESCFDIPSMHDGAMEKAILGEAALTAIQTINLHPEDEESIISDMKDYIVKAAPTVKKIAPHIMGAMMEPALRIALKSLHTYNEKGISGAEAFDDEINEPFHYSAPASTKRLALDPVSREFVSGLYDTLTHGQESLDGESEEGFFDLITTGLSFAARNGLPLLVKALSQQSVGAESFEASSSVAAPTSLSADDLGKRAIAGEAALHALMKLPKHVLEEEGIFDTILDVVKKIAPVVIKVAPTVISNISPTIGNLLKAATGQEAAFVTQNQRQHGLAPPRHQLYKKQSIPALRNNRGTNHFLGKVQQYHDQRL